jgi:hypothetical protein
MTEDPKEPDIPDDKSKHIQMFVENEVEATASTTWKFKK